MFSDPEVAFLRSQRLGRIATVSPDGQPDVAPVGFEFDGRDFYVGGIQMTRTLKYRNAQANPRVSFVVDDVESVEPWKPRGVKVHGRAIIVDRDGPSGRGPYLRIAPETHWSWGIEGPVFQQGKPVLKKAKHSR